MSLRPSWANYEPTAEQVEAQLMNCIEQGDEFLEWLSCEALADDLREPSEYFSECGGISCVEMVRKAAAGEFTAEQCQHVFKELVSRFADARHETLVQMAKEQAIKDWPEDERSRLEAGGSVQAAMARAGSGAWQS